jgi:tetratricopeptide (TPR) repeat protein
MPLDWAGAQNNLGLALVALGEREGGTERLEQAVAAFRAALEERTREHVPRDWAKTQNGLGNALRELGERESGTGDLSKSVEAYNLASAIFASPGLTYYAEKCQVDRERAVQLIEQRGGLKKRFPSGTVTWRPTKRVNSGSGPV